MRLLKTLVIVLTALVTQSCRVTMPSLVELLSNYTPTARHTSAYDFSKSQALSMQTGFKDTLVIGDDPASRHGKIVLAVVSGAHANQRNGTGVPKNNIFFVPDFQYIAPNDGNEGLKLLLSNVALQKATRVAHVPFLTPFREVGDASRVASTDILFVPAAGNMVSRWKGDRDRYNSNHANWNDSDPERNRLSKKRYGYLLDVYNTGQVIAATSARVSESGTVEPYERVVKCGDIKETCFTVIPHQLTSYASGHLAAMAFYLSQFYETPEEVVAVLRECTVDIGEPGIDREYGQGVANLLCPRVLKEEIAVVSAHLGETEEKTFTSQGGDLTGEWEADNTVLQAYLPTALKETLQAAYTGTVNGTVSFEKGMVTADFTAEATVRAVFLLKDPLAVTAENAVQTQASYTTAKDTLHIAGTHPVLYTYTATEDSLHMLQSLTLHEALALLPDPLGSMVDLTSPDFFKDTPIQIRMSFAKVSPALVGDFDGNGIVDTADFLIFVQAFGSVRGDRVYDENLDIVPDGIINIADFLLFIDQFGKTRDS